MLVRGKHRSWKGRKLWQQLPRIYFTRSLMSHRAWREKAHERRMLAERQRTTAKATEHLATCAEPHEPVSYLDHRVHEAAAPRSGTYKILTGRRNPIEAASIRYHGSHGPDV